MSITTMLALPNSFRVLVLSAACSCLALPAQAEDATRKTGTQPESVVQATAQKTQNKPAVKSTSKTRKKTAKRKSKKLTRHAKKSRTNKSTQKLGQQPTPVTASAASTPVAANFTALPLAMSAAMAAAASTTQAPTPSAATAALSAPLIRVTSAQPATTAVATSTATPSSQGWMQRPNPYLPAPGYNYNGTSNMASIAGPSDILRSLLSDEGGGTRSILPTIKKVYPTGEKPLIVVNFHCPTELLGVNTPSTKILHGALDLGFSGVNATNLLPFTLQQVCS